MRPCAGIFCICGRVYAILETGIVKTERMNRSPCGRYTLTIWAVILLAPHFLISIFSSDPTLQADTIPSMKLYFSTFGFMLLQYVGQTVFKSLNKRRHAVFFSLLRKVIIVVPLTYLLPYAFGMGTDGVFAAEPVSNVIGGSLCFIVMLITVLPELKRMDREDAKTAK